MLGDKTSHGGTVVEASSQSDCDGKAAARHGDKAGCGATLIAGQQAAVDHV